MEKLKPLFRQATNKDQETIVKFQIAMALETENLQLDFSTCTKGVAAVFADATKGIYHVVEVNGNVVGSLLVIPEWSDWRNGTVWWIHSVYLEEVCRGKGYFSKFYTYIKELINSQSSLRGLRLYVDKRNVHAQKVYKSMGMNNEHYELYEWMKTF